jgi:hypothetical protein
VRPLRYLSGGFSANFRLPSSLATRRADHRQADAFRRRDQRLPRSAIRRRYVLDHLERAR